MTTIQSLLVACLALGSSGAFAEAWLNIDADFLKAKVTEFSGATPVDIAGLLVTIPNRQSEPNKKLAREYLAQQYKALGYEVSFRPYRYGNFTGTNVVAERKGKNAEEYFIVASHYDSVMTNGADDNASGTIGAIAIASQLASAELYRTLRIVAFDQEELGTIGSLAYASELYRGGDLPGLKGVIAMDMIGYQVVPDGGYNIIDCNTNPARPENTSGNISRSILKTVTEGNFPLHRVNACTDRSDHASFWRVGAPAVLVIENFFKGENPNYHKPSDKVGTLDFKFMANLATVVGRTAARYVTKQ